MLKIVFLGTPDFAAHLLQACLSDPQVEVVGVVTRQDQPQGRNREIRFSPVKRLAQEHQLSLLQPRRCHDPESLAWFKDHQADLFVVAAFGEILKPVVLDLPPLGAINVHGSLLPAYRGAAPIQRAIMNGDSFTGVTLQRMAVACDAGVILNQVCMPIPPEISFGELRSQMAEVAAPLLLLTLHDLAHGRCLEEIQKEEAVTWAHKIQPEECFVEWERSAPEIHNLIRGAHPEPNAWCRVLSSHGERRMVLQKSKIREDLAPLKPGILLKSKGPLIVGTGTTPLELLEVQPEGKRRMSGRDFLNGEREFIKLGRSA